MANPETVQVYVHDDGETHTVVTVPHRHVEETADGHTTTGESITVEQGPSVAPQE